MRKLLVAALVALSTFDAGLAIADTSAGLLVGDGFRREYNLGAGARMGMTLPVKVYVGGTFVYHFGTDRVENRVSSYYFGPEGGYDIGTGPITLRPYIGSGFVNVHRWARDPCAYEVCGPPSSNSGELAIWPGIALLVSLGPAFVGADARYLITVTKFSEGETIDAVGCFATGGLKF